MREAKTIRSLDRFNALLALTFGVLTVAYASPSPYLAQTQGEPVSVIEVPFHLSLEQLFVEAERSVPLQTGHWGTWGNWNGIETQYRAWRGPLRFQAVGDRLVVMAEVGYWIKARKKLLKALTLSGSCGVDEPPRRAIVGVELRLAWSVDWSPKPYFRVLPTRFPDSCEMTIAKIDVTGVIGTAFQEELRQSLSQSLEKLLPHLSRARQQAERAWHRMQQPIQLGGSLWLMLRPFGVALSPLRGWGDVVKLHIGIAMRPRLVMDGSPPQKSSRPLPPLMGFYPRTTGLHMELSLELDYRQLGERIMTELAADTHEVKGQRFTITDLEIRPLEGQQTLVAELELTGDLAGRAEIWADVRFDVNEQVFKLRELDFQYDPLDPGMGFLAQAFHDRIRQALEDGANVLLHQQLGEVQARLDGMVAEMTQDHFEFDTRSFRFEQLRLVLRSSGATLKGLASGELRLH